MVAAEAIRIFRLPRKQNTFGGLAAGAVERNQALRSEAAKWGLFFTMIAFTYTLKDRWLRFWLS
jgi:hypothetical protein